MDTERELAELKHRIQAIESAIATIARAQTDDGRVRDAAEERLSESMATVAEKLSTIVDVLTGNIKTPEVPGLMSKMTKIQEQQQSNTVTLSEVRTAATALKKEFDEYRAGMPSPAELLKLKESTEAQKSRITYFMGWFGGVAAVLMVVWNVIQFLMKLSSK